MRYRAALVYVALCAVLLAGGCGKRSAGGVDVNTVDKLGIYLGGGEKTESPKAAGAKKVTRLLLDTVARLNVPAYCAITDRDVAQMRADQDAVELIFSDAIEIAIGEQIDEKDRGDTPTDKEGHQLLKVQKALFPLDGDMVAHVLLQDEKGSWGCWSIESNGLLDMGWVRFVRQALED